MARRVTELQVLRTERLSPHMVRVVAGGDDLAAFPDTEHTDRYVKLLFEQPGVDYPEPFDIDTVHAEYPREQWPVQRTYTVRSLDHALGELVIDFVHHGDTGLAGPWAAAARPGDRIRMVGPGGAYAPDPAADWHLLVGDEAALPAVCAALERIPAGCPVVAILQTDGPSDEIKLPGEAGLDVTWLHRSDAAGDPDSTQLLDAVRALEFRSGRVHAFVHGEAIAVRELRRHLYRERGLAKDDLSISGYWRRGRDEEGFREFKQAELARERAEEQPG
ncbi:siderophore-interacting protein [Pseudonocardia sp. HH130630-07]|uniref:siderophore-interacting protein n=1 Tax=Pseudonocardia sp. HH130630-07 TaxID=1690815 RepID=UPI0008151615|nr:siderophore-interacting protein [Pseudonocardia sp. HH130630-07]ANY07060.1 FAD-binding protein [Pseudonocardia sp. HH130630-07]